MALAVDLVNELGESAEADTLRSLLERHAIRSRGVTRSDVAAVADLARRLRGIFSTPPSKAVGELNALLEVTGARPRLANHDREDWHLHFASDDEPLATRLGAFAAMGLAAAVAGEGFERLKACQGEGCNDVFVDLSKNRSRRFCSPDICGNRSSVAAYRRRLRERRSS